MNLANDAATAQLARAAGGDANAFAGIVRQHQSMVYSMAWNFLRNHAIAEELAEELAQEVFLELFRSLGEIESPAHLLQWLRRVTSHRCIDQSRRAKYRPKIGLESVPEPVSIDRPRDPILISRLRHVIGQLPERARVMIVLRYQEEMEPVQIAETLNIPVGSVKSGLHRALAALRGRLERAEAPVPAKGGVS
jgi:RNA polymerase sigma-70 factor (ECF subfamily)